MNVSSWPEIASYFPRLTNPKSAFLTNHRREGVEMRFVTLRTTRCACGTSGLRSAQGVDETRLSQSTGVRSVTARISATARLQGAVAEQEDAH